MLMRMRGILPFLLFIAIISSCQKETIKENKLPTVNPGIDSTLQLTYFSDTVQLKGAATDEDGSITAYLWSQKSGPNSAKILNPGSPDTYVTGVIAGTYVFQLMVTDNQGATGVKSVSITVKKPELTTVVMQPSNSAGDLHLAVNGYGDATNPTAPEIGAVTWSFGGYSYVRGLLKFNLSSLPANATIISAKLSLYSNPTPLNGNLVDANYGSNNTMLLQRIRTDWNTSVKWQTQPATDVANEIVIPHTSMSLLDLIDLDVTDLVIDMQQKGNYGFMIKLQNELVYNSRIFCSSKYPDATKHPRLELQYVK